jgi:hypothetical protein
MPLRALKLEARLWLSVTVKLSEPSELLSSGNGVAHVFALRQPHHAICGRVKREGTRSYNAVDPLCSYCFNLSQVGEINTAWMDRRMSGPGTKK